MAGVAGGRVVPVPAHPVVMRIGVRAAVAGDAGEDGVARRVRVAGRARVARVAARGDREPRVDEPALAPRGVARLVAAVARRREARGGVVRVRRAVVVGLVTAHAGGRRPLEDVVLVAHGAGDRGVHADQREEAVVVEVAAFPSSGRSPGGSCHTSSGSPPRRGSGSSWRCSRRGGSPHSRAASPDRRCSCGTSRTPPSRARRPA